MKIEHYRFESHRAWHAYKGHGFFDIQLSRDRWRLHYARCVCIECNQVRRSPPMA